MNGRGRIIAGVVIVLSLVVLGGVAALPSIRNFHLPVRDVVVEADLPYRETMHPRHAYDLYLPRDVKDAPPVVVFVHGGFWKPQDRRFMQGASGLYGNVGVALARRGIPTAVIGYRQVDDGVGIKEAVEDVATAVQRVHVATTLRFPGSRMYVVGFSAGAMITALLALQPLHLDRLGVDPALVGGFALLGGVYDQERILAGVDPALADAIRAAAAGGDAEVFKAFSPGRYDARNHPPMLLAVGTADDPVIRAEFTHMRTHLESGTGPLTALELPDVGHMDLVMNLHREGDPVMAALLRFMKVEPAP